MAAKIDSARLKLDPSISVRADNYDTIHRPDVLCPIQRCLCDIDHVRGSSRNVGSEQIHTVPFYRLPRNAEANGTGHKPTCKYNLDRMVTRLVAISKLVKSVDENADLLIAAGKGKVVEFRLHILMELLRLTPGQIASANDNEAGMGLPIIGTRYVRSRRLLKPYFTSAKAILSLIARIRSSADLAEFIKLRYGPDTLDWSDYFYDFGRYPDLYDYLYRHKQFERGLTTNKPVSVVVKLTGKRPIRARYGWWVNCRFDYGISTTHNMMALQPSIFTHDANLADMLARQDHLLVCAIPVTSRTLKQPPPGRALNPYAPLMLNVVHRSQVCRYDPTPYEL